MNPPEAVQNWLVFIGIAATAGGVVLSLAGWLTRRTIVPALQREVERHINLAVEPMKSDLAGVRAVIDRELKPNGREFEGDPQDREQPMRVIALRAAARARRVDHEGEKTREALIEHEDAHIRRDAGWPRTVREYGDGSL